VAMYAVSNHINITNSVTCTLQIVTCSKTARKRSDNAQDVFLVCLASAEDSVPLAPKMVIFSSQDDIPLEQPGRAKGIKKSGRRILWEEQDLNPWPKRFSSTALPGTIP
jgi:NADH:ubiquinone oxidoreductase subunit K